MFCYTCILAFLFMYLYKSFNHLKTTHSYHLVDPSPWPIVAAFAAFMFTTGGVLYMQRFIGGWGLFFTGFVGLLYVMYGPKFVDNARF